MQLAAGLGADALDLRAGWAPAGITRSYQAECCSGTPDFYLVARVMYGIATREREGNLPERGPSRGCGAAGSASHWQCEGQGFESPQLHKL